MLKAVVLSAAVAAAHRGEGHESGLRGEGAEGWREKHAAKRNDGLKVSLAAKGVVLSDTPAARAGFRVGLALGGGENSVAVTCTAPAGAAAETDTAVVTAHYLASDHSSVEPILVACASDAAYLASGTASLTVQLEAAPHHAHAVLLTADAGGETYSIAARARWGEWHHGGAWGAPGGAGAAPPSRAHPLPVPASRPEPVDRSLSTASSAGPVVPSATSSHTASPTISASTSIGATPSTTPSAGYVEPAYYDIDPVNEGLTDEEKKASEKVKQEEASIGLVISVLGVGFIIFFSNQYARSASVPSGGMKGGGGH